MGVGKGKQHRHAAYTGYSGMVAVKTAAYSLIEDDYLTNRTIVCNSAAGIVITTLAAGLGHQRGWTVITNKGAGACTVYDVAGFGGGGAGRDSVTLARGEFVTVYCDGVQNYASQLPG